jgi:hypothetical protein
MSLAADVLKAVVVVSGSVVVAVPPVGWFTFNNPSARPRREHLPDMIQSRLAYSSSP